MVVSVRLDPDRASRTRPMLYTVFATAQRQQRTLSERRSAWQPSQPRRNPCTVLLRELFCVLHAAARRHSEDDFAACRKDAQCVTARLPVSAHAHRMDLAVKIDRNG